MSGPAIDVRSVSKRFGKHVALDAVSLEVAPGERVALLGHNGAGKTTLLRLVLGLTRPDRGDVVVLGAPAGSAEARRGHAYLPETVAFHKLLTGREQIAMLARLKGASLRNAITCLEKVGLGEAMDRRVGTYSKGMRQRLGLAQLIVGKPKVVILDEPTSGLDPLSRDLFYAIVVDLAQSGAAVIHSSHALTELEARTDRIAILRDGRLVADDRLARLQAGANLPIRLRVQAGSETADALAARLGGRRLNGQAVELACTPREKIARLAEVTAFGDAIRDIDVIPPSLEDLYRHYCGPEEAEASP
jgi:Cu-processing system ATP-binding protein